jgi:hypothetical protein
MTGCYPAPLQGNHQFSRMLFYQDKSEVRAGDRVLHSRDPATVVELIEGDKIANRSVDSTGFMIACERCGRVFIEAGSADWEDVSLLSRAG